MTQNIVYLEDLEMSEAHSHPRDLSYVCSVCGRNQYNMKSFAADECSKVRSKDGEVDIDRILSERVWLCKNCLLKYVVSDSIYK